MKRLISMAAMVALSVMAESQGMGSIPGACSPVAMYAAPAPSACSAVVQYPAAAPGACSQVASYAPAMQAVPETRYAAAVQVEDCQPASVVTATSIPMVPMARPTLAHPVLFRVGKVFAGVSDIVTGPFRRAHQRRERRRQERDKNR